MDIRKIKKLIELLDETGITEIEIKEGEESVRLSRHHHLSDVVRAAPPVIQAPVINVTEKNTPPTETAAGEDHQHAILAPMVGTFYSSRSPDAPPFVTLGQLVKPGDILCLIEAMKMFNEIEADKAGKIAKILITNGQPVEFGQPLFVIE